MGNLDLAKSYTELQFVLAKTRISAIVHGCGASTLDFCIPCLWISPEFSESSLGTFNTLLITLTTTKYLYFSPGVTITELHRRAGMDEETYQAFLNRCSETHVLGRPGYPDEIANAIAFLASDAASFITGVSLPVDGNFENIHNSFQLSECFTRWKTCNVPTLNLIACAFQNHNFIYLSITIKHV